jgi:aspartate kinase
MGTNLTYPGSLAKAANALYMGGVNVEAVSQSLMQVNMQFVIGRAEYKNAIRLLNQALCLDN